MLINILRFREAAEMKNKKKMRVDKKFYRLKNVY